MENLNDPSALFRLVELAGHGIFQWWPATNKCEWSSVCKKMHELSPKEMPFEDYISQIHIDEQEKCRAIWIKALEKHSSSKVEYRFLTSTGKTIWISCITLFSIDRVIGILQNISNLKRQAIEKERNLSEIMTTLDTVNVTIFGLNIEGHINKWNNHATQVTRFLEHEVLGESFIEKYIAEKYRDIVKNKFEHVIESGESSSVEVHLRTKDGSYIEILLSLTPRRNYLGEMIGVFGIGHDVTERNRTCSELKRMKETLMQQNTELQRHFRENIDLQTAMGHAAKNNAIALSNAINQVLESGLDEFGRQVLDAASKHNMTLASSLKYYDESQRYLQSPCNPNLVEKINIEEILSFHSKFRGCTVEMEQGLKYLMINKKIFCIIVLGNCIDNANKYCTVIDGVNCRPFIRFRLIDQNYVEVLISNIFDASDTAQKEFSSGHGLKDIISHAHMIGLSIFVNKKPYSAEYSPNIMSFCIHIKIPGQKKGDVFIAKEKTCSRMHCVKRNKKCKNNINSFVLKKEKKRVSIKTIPINTKKKVIYFIEDNAILRKTLLRNVLGKKTRKKRKSKEGWAWVEKCIAYGSTNEEIEKFVPDVIKNNPDIVVLDIHLQYPMDKITGWTIFRSLRKNSFRNIIVIRSATSNIHTHIESGDKPYSINKAASMHDLEQYLYRLAYGFKLDTS